MHGIGITISKVSQGVLLFRKFKFAAVQ